MANIIIDDHIHQRMKELAGKERGAIIREYREALNNHIKYKTQENISRDSGLETIMNNRIMKTEDHLASMLGRTGMDVSMVLMGVIMLLERQYKGTEVTRELIIEKLRKDGAKYFSNAIRNNKEEKHNT